MTDSGLIKNFLQIQLKFLAEEMQAISKGLEKVVQELSMSENDGIVSENFRKVIYDYCGLNNADFYTPSDSLISSRFCAILPTQPRGETENRIRIGETYAGG